MHFVLFCVLELFSTHDSTILDGPSPFHDDEDTIPYHTILTLMIYATIYTI